MWSSGRRSERTSRARKLCHVDRNHAAPMQRGSNAWTWCPPCGPRFGPKDASSFQGLDGRTRRRSKGVDDRVRRRHARRVEPCRIGHPDCVQGANVRAPRNRSWVAESETLPAESGFSNCTASVTLPMNRAAVPAHEVSTMNTLGCPTRWTLLVWALWALVLAWPWWLRPRGLPAPTTLAAGGQELQLVIISPHNDAIRREFGRAFSEWHRSTFGPPVRVDWVVIGGTTEIMRFLQTQYTEAVRAWWKRRGGEWKAEFAEVLFRERRPDDASAAELWEAYRATDDPTAFTCRLDVFFGGGTYDFQRAAAQGMLAPLPLDTEPELHGLNIEVIPTTLGGEPLRTEFFVSTALSTFGIVWNLDRIAELGVEAPRAWTDLTHPRFLNEVALADPTKSGSVAKAFEMIVQEQCHRAVRAAGFDEATVAAWEARIRAADLPPGELPPGIPSAYQAAVECGWMEGLRLIRRMAAQSRYFADVSSRIPLEVASGQAAAGLAIDFYARFQEQFTRTADGRSRLGFIAPPGGTSVSGDPIGLLRGAEHRTVALRFLRFVLSAEGQRLWAYRPGTPGGPVRYALRRLPVRPEFYPSTGSEGALGYERHRPFLADDLGREHVDPYRLAARMTYQPRWTAAHFGVLRDLVRAMCIDSHSELRMAWIAILERGGPEQNPRAMEWLERWPEVPEPLTWRSAIAPTVPMSRADRVAAWTAWFRRCYREAWREARSGLTAAAGS